MYVSPIEIVYKQMQDQMNLELENGVIKAVNSVGINIDKQEFPPHAIPPLTDFV